MPYHSLILYLKHRVHYIYIMKIKNFYRDWTGDLQLNKYIVMFVEINYKYKVLLFHRYLLQHFNVYSKQLS